MRRFKIGEEVTIRKFGVVEIGTLSIHWQTDMDLFLGSSCIVKENNYHGNENIVRLKMKNKAIIYYFPADYVSVVFKLPDNLFKMEI